MWAQTQPDSTISQSLTVERSYSPVFKEASKIDRQPAVEEVKVVPTQITYADSQTPNVRSNQIANMGVGQVIVPAESDRGGFVDFSMGNYWNADLKAGLHIGEFTLDATGFFTSGKLNTPYLCYEPDVASTIKTQGTALLDAFNHAFSQKEWQSRLGRGSLVAGWQHTLTNDAQLNAHASLSGAFANSFPFAMHPFFYVDTDNQERHAIFQQQMGSEQKQRWGQILLDAEYVADLYDVKLEYERVGIHYPDIAEHAVGIEANLLAYQADQWLVTAGLNTGLTFTEEKNYFTIRPEAEISYMPDSYSWRRLYAKVGFGTRRENLYKLMNAVPILYASDYKNTFDLFDLTLGWQDSEKGAFKYGFSANVGLTNDEVNGYLLSAADDVRNSYVILQNEDCFHVQLNGYFSYEFNRNFGAKGDITYNHEDCRFLHLTEPKLITNLHLLGRSDQFTIDLGFNGQFVRGMSWLMDNPVNNDKYAYQALNTFDELDLGAITDLSLRIDYEHSKALSFYGFVGNLINRKPQLWPGVPSQGVNVHFGANWKF